MATLVKPDMQRLSAHKILGDRGAVQLGAANRNCLFSTHAPPHKRGGVATKRGLSDEQIPVLIARARSAATTDAVLAKTDTQAIRTVLEPVFDPDAVLCSVGNAIYRSFAEQAHIVHKPVNLSAGIRVVDNAFHVQNVNAYDSRLKLWLIRFHGVATK
jgi:hypothetical protein